VVFQAPVWLDVVDDAFVIDGLSSRVCASSNMRFAWQFFRSHRAVRTTADARAALDAVVAEPDNHAFLGHAQSLVKNSALIEDAPAVMALLARAAANRLGAYAPILAPTPQAAVDDVARLFSQPGALHAFELRPDPQSRDHSPHLFSDWFYGVAWDWCFVVSWPATNLVWVGCLTDTD
jgi:hypothetical protein